VTVVRELIETEIGLDNESIARGPHRDLGRHVQDAFRVNSARPARILLLGNTEQHDTADARGRSLFDRLRQARQRMLHDSRHRGNRNRFARALAHKHRQHEFGRMQPGLGDHPAHGRRRAQPTRTDPWMQ
jgi:hypothetical protein